MSYIFITRETNLKIMKIDLLMLLCMYQYQSRNKYKHSEKYYFITQRVVNITKARSLLVKHDHVVLHELFAKNVTSNSAHKNHRNQWKNKKLSTSRRLIHFCTCILEPKKVVPLKYPKKTQKLGTFRVGHLRVKRMVEVLFQIDG